LAVQPARCGHEIARDLQRAAIGASFTLAFPLVVRREKKGGSVRILLCAVPALAFLQSADALAGDRTGAEIKSLLTGNTIVSTEFGCVYFSPTGKSVTVDFTGNTFSGSWSVKGDLYYSSGSCGEAGCRVVGEFPDITFIREGGGYRQSVTILPGNQCENNAVIL
jgi:hypothetical protein